MPRTAIPSARTVAPARRLVLPVGMKGRASLYFDGVDDRVTGTSGLAMGAPPLTLVAWAMPRTTTTRAALAVGIRAAGTSFSIQGNGAAGQWTGGVYGGGVVTGRSVQIGGWVRVVCTYAGGAAGAISLYIDGAASGAPTTGTLNLGSTVADIGRQFDVNYFAGWISDARIYSRAWTPQEVAADFRGEWVDPTGLVRRWTCENPGYGTTCYEEIGGTNDAITGALWSPSVPFRRRRIVEDVPAAFLARATIGCDVADVAALRPGLGSFGIMGWLKRIVPIADRQFWSKATAAGVGWRVASSFVVGGAPYFQINDGATSATATTNPTVLRALEWVHLAGVVDRAVGTIQLFIDATRRATTAIGAVGALSGTEALRFGRLAFGSGEDALHNDVVYRVGAPFAWDEIEAHYYDGIVPTAPAGSVQIGWGMREGAGTNVASIPDGYAGTLSAASWTTSTRCKARTSV